MKTETKLRVAAGLGLALFACLQKNQKPRTLLGLAAMATLFPSETYDAFKELKDRPAEVSQDPKTEDISYQVIKPMMIRGVVEDAIVIEDNPAQEKGIIRRGATGVTKVVSRFWKWLY